MNDKEYELLEYVFQLAYGSAYTEEIKEISDLENKIIKKLKNEDKAIEYMEHYIEVEDAPINERIKIEFKEVIKLLKGVDKE